MKPRHPLRKALSELPLSLAAVACAFTLAAAAQPAPPDNKAAVAGFREMKVAFDLTDGDPKSLLAKLNVIDVTRRQLVAEGVTPKIVLAFRGDASYLTQIDAGKIRPADREAAARVAAKIREMRTASGVEAIEQCALPLPARGIRPDDVMQEVKVVGNGWISLVSYQHRGYAYIAP